MAGAGDYVYYQWMYQRVILDKQVTIFDSTLSLRAIMSPRSAAYALFIQKITVRPIVYSAQTWVFQDEAATPVQIASLVFPSSAPTIVTQPDYQVDLGPLGYRLTAGSPLDIVITGSGVAAALHIEAYQKLPDNTSVAMETAGIMAPIPYNVIADPSNVLI